MDPRTSAMTGYRSRLTFAVSNHNLLTDLEREFSCHDDVATSADSDGTSFFLTIDFPDTAAVAWEVRATVRSFDPDATIRQPVGL